MKIGIDARFYGPTGKGLGRYTQEIVDNVIRISGASVNSDFEFVVFLNPTNFDEFICDNPQVKKVKVFCSWYSWQEQIFMPFYLWREKLDLIHFPHFNVPILTPLKFVVTIHDLILTHFPTTRATTKSNFLYYFKDLAYRLVIFTALHRAQKIIAVSEFTKNDIIKKFKIKADKIVVTYEGVANLSRGRDSLFVSKLDNLEVLSQYHIPHNYLLYVGNAYPHKNLEMLLRVFNKLLTDYTDLKLVLVGKSDYFYERIKAEATFLNLWQKENSNSPVIFPGYVPDAQLEILYAEAKAYIFPTLYEGFGLPPLEAMANGCPVLSSNSSSLPEILGPAALYFNPSSEEEIMSQIKFLINNQEKREELKILGRIQAKKYSWWECANKTLDVYGQVK